MFICSTEHSDKDCFYFLCVFPKKKTLNKKKFRLEFSRRLANVPRNLIPEGRASLCPEIAPVHDWFIISHELLIMPKTNWVIAPQIDGRAFLAFFKWKKNTRFTFLDGICHLGLSYIFNSILNVMRCKIIFFVNRSRLETVGENFPPAFGWCRRTSCMKKARIACRCLLLSLVKNNFQWRGGKLCQSEANFF